MVALERDIVIIGSQHDFTETHHSRVALFPFFFQEHQSNKPGNMVNVEYLKFRKSFEKISQNTLVDKLKNLTSLLRWVQDHKHKSHLITNGAN